MCNFYPTGSIAIPLKMQQYNRKSVTLPAKDTEDIDIVQNIGRQSPEYTLSTLQGNAAEHSLHAPSQLHTHSVRTPSVLRENSVGTPCILRAYLDPKRSDGVYTECILDYITRRVYPSRILHWGTLLLCWLHCYWFLDVTRESELRTVYV